jgi:hypothetical protein
LLEQFFDLVIDFFESSSIGTLTVGFEKLDVAFVKGSYFLVGVRIFVVCVLLFKFFPIWMLEMTGSSMEVLSLGGMALHWRECDKCK